MNSNGLKKTVFTVRWSICNLLNSLSKIAGKSYLMLSSNSYLGLCNDQRLKQAAMDAMEKYGVGSGGSSWQPEVMRCIKSLKMKSPRLKEQSGAAFQYRFIWRTSAPYPDCAGKDWVIFFRSFQSCQYHRWLPAKRRRNHYLWTLRCLWSGTKAHSTAAGGLWLSLTGSLVCRNIAPLPEIVQVAKKYNMLLMVRRCPRDGSFRRKRRGTAGLFWFAKWNWYSDGNFQ